MPALKAGKPKKRGSRRLILLLLFFFLIVFAYLFFQSSLGKIAEIRITGTDMTTQQQLTAASGVQVGDSFFLLKKEEVEKRLLTVPAVQSVKVWKVFPGVLNMEVKEYARAGYQLGKDGSPEAVLADGRAYKLTDKDFPSDRPILTGWKQDGAEWKELVQALAAIPEEQLSDISEIKPFPNVFPDRIKLYTRSQFEVITRIALLKDKLPQLPYFTNEFKRKNGTTGILTLLEQDRGIPFPSASVVPSSAP